MIYLNGLLYSMQQHATAASARGYAAAPHSCLSAAAVEATLRRERFFLPAESEGEGESEEEGESEGEAPVRIRQPSVLSGQHPARSCRLTSHTTTKTIRYSFEIKGIASPWSPKEGATEIGGGIVVARHFREFQAVHRTMARQAKANGDIAAPPRMPDGGGVAGPRLRQRRDAFRHHRDAVGGEFAQRRQRGQRRRQQQPLCLCGWWSRIRCRRRAARGGSGGSDAGRKPSNSAPAAESSRRLRIDASVAGSEPDIDVSLKRSTLTLVMKRPRLPGTCLLYTSPSPRDS